MKHDELKAAFEAGQLVQKGVITFGDGLDGGCAIIEARERYYVHVPNNDYAELYGEIK